MKNTYFKGSSKGLRPKAQKSDRGGVVKPTPHKKGPSATKWMGSFQEPLLHLIDIGNTSATYGLVKNGKIAKTVASNSDAIPEIIQKNSNNRLKSKNIVIISSVVPKNTEKLVSNLYCRGNFDIYEIGKDIPVPLRHNYKNANKLGVDRKINAFGAVSSKKTPCLVFDYGTALTCDLVDEKGVFLGGLIIPGPATSLKSLLDRAALLPKAFNLKKQLGLPYGRDTNECIQRGIIQAYAAMTDGLIERLGQEFKRKPYVIITGGFSSFIGKIMHSKAEINPAHTLESMFALYKTYR